MLEDHAAPAHPHGEKLHTAAPAGRWGRLLTRAGWPLIVALLATVLMLPALGTGFLADDYFHRASLLPLREFPELIHPPLDLFAFSYGDPVRLEPLIDHGIAPWWTLPELKMAFCRPLSSLTHWLDYRLWPDSPGLMHAQNLLWFFLFVAGSAVFFRRIFGATLVAALAALLFALDDAHATPAGWIAGRNTLVAATFGVWCLVAHDRWRRAQWRPGAVLAPLLFALALLSAEAGVATLAYLVPHAVFLDRARGWRRLAALLPYGVLLIVWRIAWAMRGYGVAGVGAYVDPVGAPLEFIRAVLDVGPVLLLGQWGLPPSDMYALYDVFLAGSARFVWLFAVLFLALTGLVLRRRLAPTPEVAFCASGMLIALLPICATVDFPMDRLLLFVGLGACGLLALFLERMLGLWRARKTAPARPRLWWPSLALAAFFVLVHLVLAPITLVTRAAAPAGPAELTDQFYLRLTDAEVSPQRDLVVVNAPSSTLVGMFPVMQAVEHGPLPRRMRMLGPSLNAVTVTRRDAHTLRIASPEGWFAWSYDHLLRGPEHGFSPGDVVALTGMTATVVEVNAAGRPTVVDFTFDTPLDDPSLQWLQWRDGRFIPFTLPALGEAVQLPPAQPKIWSPRDAS